MKYKLFKISFLEVKRLERELLQRRKKEKMNDGQNNFVKTNIYL